MPMDINELTQLINGCGFPIAACGALFWMLNSSFKELTVAINNLGERLGEQMHMLMNELRKEHIPES